MPTLAPPVLDTGGTGSGPDARPPSVRKPLTIVLAFVGALVVTVVVLRLVLGPFGGDEPTDGDTTTSAEQPTATVGAGAGLPPATVTRPADAQETPDGLARQFLLEFLTRQPGESPAHIADRMHDLLSPEYAFALAEDTNGEGRAGSIVEVGAPTASDPDIFEMEASLWSYGPDEAVADAVPSAPQVWRVAVRQYLGLWTVTAAQPV